ncbi:CAMK family protein kinase [Tritrichomonas foetus]|uniref:CAMK family protein kinase n=1 Tax=Tritrichomonas foetus TaxID=1144522 RepID=A0A1J4KIE2_9EUKA|nr:CAMK family protein kinase [Tritrichomonas foetus]|eukprot:OHT09454.1 CAMK family protein kinase [Tritrichomonas foetus]
MTEQQVQTLKEHDYILEQKIGQGNFAKVYLVTSERYREKFVCKMIENPQLIDEDEIKLLCNLDSSYIISMYDYFKDAQNLYIILEYCPGGSVQDILDHQGPLDIHTLFEYTKQTLFGLQHCHLFNIAHEDIKPANILLNRNNRAKLADFGLSQCLNKGELRNRFSGSRAFIAPEILKGNHYDPFKADVWALGITCFMMATGMFPWPLTSAHELFAAIEKCDLSILDNIDAEYANVIKMMLVPDPNRRATVNEILGLPIFQEHKSNSEHIRSIKSFSSVRVLCSHFSSNPIVPFHRMQVKAGKKRPGSLLKHSGSTAILTPIIEKPKYF